MISEWNYKLISGKFGLPPIDVLTINDGTKIYIVKYERNQNFCYHEKIKDYVFSYTPDIEFLTLFNYLKRVRNHTRFTEQ